MSISAIVSAISDEVVAKLATGNYEPLAEGRILIGRQDVDEHTTPPRIVFIPQRSRFGPKNVSDPRTSASESRAIRLQRAIASELITFEVRCWGTDFDSTRALYHAVIQAAHSLAAGLYTVENGEWPRAKDSATQHMRLGDHFVFGLTLSAAVLDTLIYREAPANVAPVLTNTLTIPGKGSGQGCG